MPNKEDSKEAKLIVDKMAELEIGESFSVKKDSVRIHKKIRNIIFQSRETETVRYSAISKMTFSVRKGNTFVHVVRMT